MALSFRRFAVEGLCLLMLLYGAPLQALESNLPKVEVEAPDIPLEMMERSLDSASQSLETAWRATEEVATGFVQQPWADAFTMMLAASSFGATQETSSPPSPPSEERSAKEFDLASLAKGFPDKDALDAIPLLPGWNQVSLPEVPGTPDPATVLRPIGGSYSKVYAYDGCDATDPWKVYDPTDPASSDLTSIGVTQGLLVDATAAVSLPSDGSLPDSTTVSLCTGWNLIGFPSARPRHVRSALAPIMDKVVRVFGFDPFEVDDPWAFFEKDAPAWASDLDTMEPGMGYWILVTEDVTLEIKNVGDAPDIDFTSPVDLDVVTAPTEIHGRVTSDLLESWQLRYRGVGESDWVDLADGNYPVNGKLGDFDPTLLLNGMYEIELTATDLQGLQVSDSIAVVVEGNMKIGHFTLSFVDLAIPLSGLDIEVVRTYDSRQRHLQGDFGYGWSLDIRQGSYRNNRPPGDGWIIHATDGPWGLPCSPDAIQETKSHLTTIRLSDQEVYRFRLVVEDPGTIIGGCIGRADFEYVDGPIPGATLEILGNTSVLYQNNTDELRDPNTFALYVPEDVKLTTRDGRIFHLDLNDGVTHLEDLNGNTLDITPEGITHSSGRGVEFVRDTEGRIERIIDPMGNANVYAYDAAGDHVTFTDRVGAETRFAYTDGHYLEDIVNALGVRAVRTEYDDDGRMVRMIDAAGKVTSFEHDLDNRREVLTDRLGFIRVAKYDLRGNVTHETDELGNTTTRVYDGSDNMLEETDPLGRTVRYSFNAFGDQISHEDALGRLTEWDYNSFGQETLRKDPNGNLARQTYDGLGQLVKIEEAGGQETIASYNARGDLLSVTDALGFLHSQSYDDYGNLVEETDPLGHRTQRTFDPNGQIVSESRTRTAIDGSEEIVIRNFTYDANGQLVSVSIGEASTHQSYDALGRQVSSTDLGGQIIRSHYDPGGRLVQRVFADATSQQWVYNAEGRATQRIDQAGRSTHFEYDAAGRLTKTTFADGAQENRTYDAAGQLVSLTDPLQRTTQYEYDAAGQLIKRMRPDQTVIETSYDGNGNRIRRKDPLGRLTQWSYDSLDRITERVFADGTSKGTFYDAGSRRTGLRDELGGLTAFSYDPLGRIAGVTDEAGHATSYAYNELGQRLSQTDSLQRSTLFDYSPLGAQIQRQLPGGYSEHVVPNSDGRPMQITDFQGNTTTLAYDAMDRLTKKSYPDGTFVEYTYTSTGRQHTVNDFRGTTTYTYDQRDRLASVTHPQGHKLDYTYDLAGNLLRLQATVGQSVLSTSYTYDSLDRLHTITDAQGEVYEISYDPAGRPISTGFPNGVTTQSTFDVRDRLTHRKAQNGGEVVFEEHYERRADGRLIQAQDLDHRHLYSYDALHRLVGVQREDLQGSWVGERSFTYDDASNRTAITVIAGGEAETVLATFDERDRLTSLDGQPLTWDANGRLIVDETSTTYSWDFDHRLRGATFSDGSSVQLDYDADDHLIRYAFQPVEGDPEVVYCLVDSQGSLSHVVVEYDDQGNILNHYTRAGDRLLSVFRPASGEKRFYHRDGLGSIRALTDASGDVTDRYAYSPFGVLESRIGTDPNTYRFTGEPYFEKLSLAYHRARWLDPEVGRFISMDPYAGTVLEPMSLHRYLYGNADPINSVDPTGEKSVASFAIAASVFTAVAVGLLAGAEFFNERKFKKLRENASLGEQTEFQRSRDTAAIKGMRAIYSRCIAENIEYCGPICNTLDTNKCQVGPPQATPGFISSCATPRCSDLKARQVGSYHCHGDGTGGAFGELFSPEDQWEANIRKTTWYLVTPRGVMKKYHGWTGAIEIVHIDDDQ